jgi:hypothetical protein
MSMKFKVGDKVFVLQGQRIAETTVVARMLVENHKPETNEGIYRLPEGQQQHYPFGGDVEKYRTYVGTHLAEHVHATCEELIASL